MRFRSLQSRIILVFMGLFVVVLAGALFAVDRAITQNARHQIKTSLTVGGRVFRNLFDSRTGRLTESVVILSKDFALREAIATQDYETMRSALENHGERVGADIVILSSLDNTLLVNTREPGRHRAAYPYPELIEIARQRGQASAILPYDGATYQMVVVPLLAPDPIAWICVGFAIDAKLVKKLGHYTSSHVTLMLQTPDGRRSSIASTLPAALHQHLFASPLVATAGKPQTLQLDMSGDEYETLTLPLSEHTGAIVSAVLQRPLEEALRPFYPLRALLGFLSVAGIALSLGGSVFLARRVTRPVSELLGEARAIGAGNYGHAVTVRQRDELGELAAAFNHMSQGIAEREQHIRHLAFHDPLTGLPNRLMLQEEIARLIAAPGAKPFALVILGLERFKEINFTLGFEIGDLILKGVGGRLIGLASCADNLIAHLGGSEFALLLHDVEDARHIGDVAQRVMRDLENPFWVHDQPFELGATFGVALYPAHGAEAEALIKHAEAAMRQAKADGGEHAVFSPDFEERNLRRLALIGKLRQALAAGELQLYYQPKLDLASGRVIGMEALIRWLDPQEGFNPPDEFIPVIEQSALIKPFTQMVLHMALSQCRRQLDQGIRLGMAVNLSTRNLTDPQLPEQVAELLRQSGVPAELLTLEITESAIMLQAATATKVITGLSQLGVQISVDDFGTGYTSLSHLRKLPVGELKIDKSFVLGMDRNDNDAVIVQSTIDLAHNLGLKVTAEGVENQAVWDQLKELGCDQAQGFYMSRPLPPEALEKWLAESPWSSCAAQHDSLARA